MNLIFKNKNKLVSLLFFQILDPLWISGCNRCCWWYTRRYLASRKRTRTFIHKPKIIPFVECFDRKYNKLSSKLLLA